MKTSAGNLKRGEFVSYLNEIWQVQKAEFYSPGKGSALMKTRIKNVMNGKNIEYTFKSNEMIETIEVESVEMQYPYKDAEYAYFMNERNYNQYQLPLSVVGDMIEFMKDGNKYFIYVHNDTPLTIRPSLSERLKVVEAEDAAKGDTVSGAKKPVKLETGATIMAPIFVKVGETIIVNPETREYVGRE